MQDISMHMGLRLKTPQQMRLFTLVTMYVHTQRRTIALVAHIDLIDLRISWERVSACLTCS